MNSINLFSIVYTYITRFCISAGRILKLKVKQWVWDSVAGRGREGLEGFVNPRGVILMKSVK